MFGYGRGELGILFLVALVLGGAFAVGYLFGRRVGRSEGERTGRLEGELSERRRRDDIDTAATVVNMRPPTP